MITSVYIQNFLSLRNINLNLERLTVLVGPNGSGKRSVLNALQAVVQAVALPDPHLWFLQDRHCDWLYTRGGKGDMVVSCMTTSSALEMRATPPPHFHQVPCNMRGKCYWPISITSSPAGTVKSLCYLQLNAKQLARPHHSSQSVPAMEADGEGLVSVLEYMALFARDSFEMTMEYAQLLIPSFRRIRFQSANTYRIENGLAIFQGKPRHQKVKRSCPGVSLLFDFEHAQGIPAHAVGDGALYLLGLLTVLFGPHRPDVLLLEGMENHLHPQSQKQLIFVLRRILNQFPGLQIVGTTHSPYLLDHLQPIEIRLTASNRTGHCVIAPLSTHPLFSQWRDEMSPGELWSLFGEKWLVEDVL